MSDKPARKTAEIQQEYNQLAFQAGQVQYQIFVFENDLKLINDRLRDLNFEGAESIKREEEVAKQVEEKLKKTAEEAKTPSEAPKLAVVKEGESK